MAVSQANHKFPGMLKYAALIVIGVGLYAGREIFIPVALAVLLCFLLAPVVTRLQKWHLPRVPAVLLVMLLLCGAVVGGGWLIAGQLLQMADKLPQYQQTVHEKLQSLHSKPGGTFDRINHTFDSYASEVESIASQPATTQAVAATQITSSASQPEAIEVKLAPSRASGVEMLRSVIVGALSPIVTLGIVMILTLFMLIQREDLRDRAIRLMGGSQLHLTTDALDDAGQRVSRYLLLQLVVNVIFGICIWLGLFLLGVPYSPLWGALAGIMRFMPYFGVPAASIPPMLMAFVSAPGFHEILFTLGLFVMLEIGISYFVEPWLYGSKTGISPLAILVSALFWAWIWGPAGLLLSTPLTVCLAVMGRHIPGLRFLQVVFGDEPALKPESRLYQRLLSNDLEEAQQMAEEKLKESSLTAFYDSLLIPSLVLAEHNRHRGELDEAREQFIFDGIANLIQEMEEQDEAARRKRLERGNELDETPVPNALEADRPLVLCLGASDGADELGARMLAGLLRGRGIDARVNSAETLTGESVALVGELRPELVCISAVPPHAALQARYLCKRLRSAYPQLKIVVGLWQSQETEARIQERLPSTLADFVVTKVQDAVERIVSQVAMEAHMAETPAVG